MFDRAVFLGVLLDRLRNKKDYPPGFVGRKYREDFAEAVSDCIGVVEKYGLDGRFRYHWLQDSFSGLLRGMWYCYRTHTYAPARIDAYNQGIMSCKSVLHSVWSEFGCGGLL